MENYVKPGQEKAVLSFLKKEKFQTYQDKITSTKHKAVRSLDLLILIGSFFVMFGAMFLVYQFQPDFERVHLERMQTTWGPIVMTVTIILLALKVSFL